MDEKKRLPMYGVGPVYVSAIIILTIVGILLSIFVIPNGRFDFLLIPFATFGALLIFGGICLWVDAVLKTKIDDGIKKNKLVTTGVYSCVRNPIYSAFLFACTGALLIANNLWLLILPPVYWLFLTILMKNTEEKWLKKTFGKEYEEYCKRVNRCIPWFPKRRREK